MKLYLALELSNKKWKLAFTTGQKIRLKTIEAGDLGGLQMELSKTRKKWNLPSEIAIYSVFEAGRDGFWIHRYLEHVGITNVVVDPASIEVNRRKRRAKTDRLDVQSLVRQLMRYDGGEPKVWSVVRVPSEQDEDERRREREVKRLKKEISSGIVRIKSLLVLHGVRLASMRKLAEQLPEQTGWNGKALPPIIVAEILRENDRVDYARSQLKDLEKDRAKRLENPKTKAECTAKKLFEIRGIGVIGAMTLSEEFFSWRNFNNVREVGASAGLTGSAYDSGDSRIEQGISKAGSAVVRSLCVELAWGWLRHQPDSYLSQWFHEKFGNGRRSRRVGIVALARKLLVALWKYLKFDEIPQGAQLKPIA